MILGPLLSPTLAPILPHAEGSVPRALQRLAGGQWQSVQLSAAQRGLRPRELDRRARKDLMALLGRRGLMAAGLDLMIPRQDWLSAETVDRAVNASLAAMELAADLGRIPLALPLPVEDLAEDVKNALLTGADGYDVPLAVHAEDQLDALLAWLEGEDQPMLGAGLDPAILIALERDPAMEAARMGRFLKVARLDDYLRTGGGTEGGRRPVGHGELDVLAYRATLQSCAGLRAIVVELRDLADPLGALQAAGEAWEEATL